jgi:hypothetical protein
LTPSGGPRRTIRPRGMLPPRWLKDVLPLCLVRRLSFPC